MKKIFTFCLLLCWMCLIILCVAVTVIAVKNYSDFDTAYTILMCVMLVMLSIMFPPVCESEGGSIRGGIIIGTIILSLFSFCVGCVRWDDSILVYNFADDRFYEYSQPIAAINPFLERQVKTDIKCEGAFQTCIINIKEANKEIHIEYKLAGNLIPNSNYMNFVRSRIKKGIHRFTGEEIIKGPLKEILEKYEGESFDNAKKLGENLTADTRNYFSQIGIIADAEITITYISKNSW